MVSNNYIIDYKIYYNKNILELPFDQFFNNNKNCFYIKEAYYNSNLIVSHTNHFGCLYRNSSYFEIFYEFNIFNYLDYKPSIIDYYLIEHDFLIINKPLVEDLILILITAKLMLRIVLQVFIHIIKNDLYNN